MAVRRGNDGQATIDGTSIGVLSSWSVEQNAPSVPLPIMGQSFQGQDSGQRPGTATLTIAVDEKDAGYQALLAAKNTDSLDNYLIYPKGNSTGLPQLAFSARVLSIRDAGQIDQMLAREISLSLTTDVTETNVA